MQFTAIFLMKKIVREESYLNDKVLKIFTFELEVLEMRSLL